MKYDVIVIGAGLAGFIAASKAADRGKSVLLVASGLGSIGISTGCIDVFGKTTNPVQDPLAYLHDFVATKTEHPYAKAGLAALTDGLDFFCGICNRSHYPYLKKKTTSGSANYLIPSSSGTLKTTFLIPETMTAGDRERKDSALIVGFKGFRDFCSTYVADKLNNTNDPTSAARYSSTEIDMEFNHTRVVTAYDIASSMEQTDFRSHFASKVKASKNDCSRIGVPAVLGVTRWREVLDALQQSLGCELFEIPTMPPSVPGIRLHNIMLKQLKTSGVTTLFGYPAHVGTVSGKQCVSLEVQTPGRSRALYGDTFILGTGGILGGGIETDTAKILKESVFGLPVDQNTAYADWFNSESMLHGQHPIDLFGLNVDEQLHPVDRTGEVLLENVHIVGRSLAHYAPFAELSGNGVAIATGYKAGLLA